MLTTKAKLIFLKELLYLKEVMDEGQIQLAAQKNGVKQNNLSKDISDLERNFDCVLLHRSPRGVMPSNTAQIIYSDVEQIDKILEKLLMQYLNSEELSGDLTLWTEEGFIGNPILKEFSLFYATYPHIRLDVLTDPHTNPSKVDVAIVKSTSRYAKTGKHLFQVEVKNHFYSTKNYLERKGCPQDLNDLLENYDLCVKKAYLGELKYETFLKRAKHLNTTADSTVLVANLVNSGDGISFMPDWISLIYPNLVRVPNIDIETSTTFIGICKPEKYMNPKIQVLADFLNKNLNK